MIALMSRLPAGCSMLLRLQPGKLGRRSHEAVLVVQIVPRSRMNEVADQFYMILVRSIG